MKTEAGCENQQFRNVKYFLKAWLLMESVTRASKAPQKHCLVQAAVPKKLRNDLAKRCIAKEVGMLKASLAGYITKEKVFIFSPLNTAQR